MSQRSNASSIPGTPVVCWRDGERGSGAGEHDGRGVLRRLRAETHRTVLREVRPRLRVHRRSASCQLSFGKPGRSSAACRLFGDRRSAAGHLFFDSRISAGRLSCDRRSASDCLSYLTSCALPLCADWHARTRTTGFYIGQEYHRLARWTYGAFSETKVCICCCG